VRLTLIVNPKASAYTPKRRAAVEEVLGQGNELTVTETLYRNHAIDQAREAANAGAHAVVVLGGDGTVNEGANGLVGTKTALAVLPGGSTNVFARTIGMKKKVKPAVAQLRDALGQPPKSIGLGLVNGRYFLFHVGMGYDAAVVEKVEQKPDLKRKLGQAVFVYAAFATWFRRFDRKAPHLAVHEDGAALVEDGYFAICLNSNPYTYLGVRRLQVAPEATLDQPLVLVTLRTIKFGKFLPLVGSTLGSGKKLQNSKWVDYRPGLKEIAVAAAPGRQAFPWQADGDYLGEAERLTFTWEPDRLLLVTP
jgi:diacylglycerol kinase family enzyme